MKRTLAVFVVLMMGSLAFMSLAPPASAASPSLAQLTGGSAASTASITSTLSSVTAGDAIFVVQFFAGEVSPCNYMKTPTDGLSNNYRSLGCVADGSFGAHQEWYASSGAGTVNVNCNWQPNADFEACYVFDVVSPGAVNLLGTAKGFGTSMGLAFNAAGGALILNTVSLDGDCETVGTFGFINPVPTVYNPGNECFLGTYGLSGSSQVASAGADQWYMTTTKQTQWTEFVVQIQQQVAPVTTTTIYTATVTGWLVPDAAHFANTYILVILPLAGMVFALMPFMMFQRPVEIGDKAIYPALSGFAAGATLADVGVNGTTGNQVPFAFIFVAALLVFLWWWNS